jgi:hypothetical protein
MGTARSPDAKDVMLFQFEAAAAASLPGGERIVDKYNISGSYYLQSDNCKRNGIDYISRISAITLMMQTPLQINQKKIKKTVIFLTLLPI